MADTNPSPDLPKLQRHNVGDMKDIISNMPDVILHYILSLLSTKEAVRTSILSTKWRYLWTQLSVYDFENPHPQYPSHYLLDLVGRLLHKSNHLEKLCIKIDRITVDTEEVSFLISSTAKHKVQDFQLSIDDLKYLDTAFLLPNCFSTSQSLNMLSLQLGFILHIPAGICFPSLKTLNVSYIRFANEMSVQRLFSGCPVLQELTWYKCLWEYINQISIAISTLRALTIHSDSSCLDYDHFDICTVKIDAVNLLSLTCTSTPILEFVLVNPLISIIDANICLTYYYPQSPLYAAHSAFQLLSGLSSVKSLALTIDTFQCLYYSEIDTLHLLPLFHNLTHLYMPSGSLEEFTIEILMDILHKTPKLRVLKIPMVFSFHLDGEDLAINSVPFCFKSSLKLFYISSFFGYKFDIQLVKLLLENATVLEEMQISFGDYLSSNLEKLADVKNQLQALGQGKCRIKLQ